MKDSAKSPTGASTVCFLFENAKKQSEQGKKKKRSRKSWEKKKLNQKEAMNKKKGNVDKIDDITMQHALNKKKETDKWKA